MKSSIAFCALAIISLGLGGCGTSQDKATTNTPESQVSTDGHSHDGWWCNEHGVPESVCAQCNPKLAADFKAKGDWCKDHDRPDSQCFVCHPEQEAVFAAQYEAKYGKKPPHPSDESGEQDHHEHGTKS